MAQQKGLVKLRGTLDDFTFTNRKNGEYRVRHKTSLDKSRVYTDDKFQRTRENMAEFTRAMAANKLFKESCKPLVRNISTPRLHTRLFTEMMRMVKLDAINDRGQRQVLDAETTLMEGFEFNTAAFLPDVLPLQFTSSIDRATGALQIDIPAFTPQTTLVPPEGATHFQILTAALEISFENNTYHLVENHTGVLPWDGTAIPASSLTCNLTPGSTHPLFQFVGLQFFQEILNGSRYPLKNGANNALRIVKVDA